MTPTGLAFAWFTTAVVALYWLGPRRVGWQNGVLLVASYLFYASWSLEWLPLLVATTALDFGVSRALAGPNGNDRTRRRLLAASLVVNFGALAWLKYRGFFVDSLEALLGSTARTSVAFALPIGLSYYTLVKVGYLLDVYHRRVKPPPSLVDFATFIAFFPQMLAGPITRASAVLPQLATARRVQRDTFSGAGAALLLGWWMKAYVADWLAPHVVDPVFASAGTLGSTSHWLALGSYAAQIFCDFAGYSLLAIGAARLFGIELPQNFDRPFLSRSMPEFWRRWHISLNTWLFDYLYGPWTTGHGALHGRVVANMVLVFVLSGLWHGAAWTFVLWGALQGLALATHHVWDVWYRGRCRIDRRWVEARRSTPYAVVAWAMTLAWFAGSLVLFRSESLTSAGRFLQGLLGGGAGSLMLDKLALLNLGIALLFVVVHHLEGLPVGRRVRALYDGLPTVVVGVLAGLVVTWLLVFAPLARGTFIYAQF